MKSETPCEGYDHRSDIENGTTCYRVEGRTMTFHVHGNDPSVDTWIIPPAAGLTPHQVER